ncbi:diacylglycerol O-acyltransferase 1-like [Artemia franciscana]|uniref:O-acyltransferase n=1 Tax=Artemia franciscana TaxID=6661 RepID=A0AA88ID20_ARTSF|nr:hypothetical protein QYM36_001409 [Artemia franciscana]
MKKMLERKPSSSLTAEFQSTGTVDTSKGLAQEETRVKLRRTKSVTRAEEIVHEEEKARKLQPDKPCHYRRDSLFSWTSGFGDFRGFINLAFLLLLLGGARLFLENVMKYGIRVDPVQWLIVINGGSSEVQNEYPSILLFIYLNVPIWVALGIERLLAKDLLRWKAAKVILIVNLISILAVPIVAINLRAQSFGLIGATMSCFVYTITFLKLWSYMHVNYWCRLSRSGKSTAKHARTRSFSFHQSVGEPTVNGKTKHLENFVSYPDNLTLKDIYFFMILPTLCYELNFPISGRIRKRFLIKRILETLIGSHVVLALFQQWIIPSVKNSLTPFSNMDLLAATERLLKLSIPNHLIWLIWFYLVFHSYLNMVAEVTRFADREFYLDWWNSNNIDVFWRSWNMPAHRWALRHLYMPLVSRGYNKFVSAVAVFMLSAFFHEYLVSVPLRMFKAWAFLGMLSQIPMSMVSLWIERKIGPRIGNVFVWLGIILGQPLCIMMYYHDYVIEHFGKNLIQQFSTV